MCCKIAYVQSQGQGTSEKARNGERIRFERRSYKRINLALPQSVTGPDYSYFQIDGPLAKKLHKADPERTTCGSEYFMMRVRSAMVPTPAASPITAEDMKIEVRISPPESAPRDSFCEGPIDLKVAVSLQKTSKTGSLLVSL